jgi:hypothetical protein|eukprot:GHVL01023700.1.p1 GENE.GHVL01023700.1~~GHVL01023700.1.p1  ORF type:complete len:111 (-),score=2.11 GHVL01023700.1:1304-1636(-)
MTGWNRLGVQVLRYLDSSVTHCCVFSDLTYPAPSVHTNLNILSLHLRTFGLCVVERHLSNEDNCLSCASYECNVDITTNLIQFTDERFLHYISYITPLSRHIPDDESDIS